MVDGGSSSLHRPTNLTHAPVAVGPLKAAGNTAQETFAGSFAIESCVLSTGHMMNTLHGHILSRPRSKMQHGISGSPPMSKHPQDCVNAHLSEMESSSMNLITQESTFKMQPVPAGSLQWPTQRAEVQLEKAHSPKRSHDILRNPTRSNNMRAKIWVGVIDISGLPFHQ